MHMHMHMHNMCVYLRLVCGNISVLVKVVFSETGPMWGELTPLASLSRLGPASREIYFEPVRK